MKTKIKIFTSIITILIFIFLTNLVFAENYKMTEQWIDDDGTKVILETFNDFKYWHRIESWTDEDGTEVVLETWSKLQIEKEKEKGNIIIIINK